MPENLTKLVARLGRTVHCIQFAEGLNPAQWEALRYLGRANRLSRTPSGLAAYLQTTKGTASQTLKCLEGKGLVARVCHPKDRRASLLDLTDDGQALLTRDPLKRLELVATDMGSDLQTLSALMGRLATGLEAAADRQGFGVCKDCALFCQAAEQDSTTGPHRCGLTQDPLSAADSEKICANFSA